MTTTEDAYRCAGCGKEIDPNDGKMVDFGIGEYEFWGTRCIDIRWNYVSPCCEADILGPDGYPCSQPEKEYDGD